MPPAAPSRPGLIDPHTHLLFAGSREAELAAPPARRGLPRDPRGRRRDPLDRRRDPRRVDRRADGPRPALARRDARPRRDDDRGEVRLRPRPRDRDPPDRGRPIELGTEGPIDVVPTYLGAHAVPPEFRSRPDGTEAYVRSSSRSSSPAWPPTAGHGSATSSARTACSTRISRGGSWRRRPGSGSALRLHADELAPSGGAELAADLGAQSADHLATPSEAGIYALAAAAADAEEDRAVVATVLPATTWFLMKDHGAPARTFIDRGIPLAIGTDFNPGTSPTASLPLAMTVACLELGLSPDEALSAVTINAARAARPRGRDRVDRARQGGGSRHLAGAELDADPVLARGRPDAGRDQARAGRRRPELTPVALRPACRGTRAGPSSFRPAGSTPSPTASAG